MQVRPMVSVLSYFLLFGIITTLYLCSTGCTHGVGAVSDLRIGKEYVTIGAHEENLRECNVKLFNIVTMMLTEMGPVPVKALTGSDAIVCGEFDCTESMKDEEAKGFDCMPLDALQPPKKE